MSTPPSPPTYDAFGPYAIEYERRVEPFTSQFVDDMLHSLLVNDDDKSYQSEEEQQQQQQCGERRKRRLLDVGCGTGAASLIALSHGYDVTSTDFSSAMVERTKERVIQYVNTHSSSNNGSQILADGQSLPPEWSNSFDVAISNFGVIFFPNPTAGLKEIHRCLIPSTGWVAFSAWGDASETPAFQVFPNVSMEIVPELVSSKPSRITGSIAALTQLLKDAGFVDISISGPISKTLVVTSPEEYYNRFALTSPPSAELIQQMDDDTKFKFRERIMQVSKERGGRQDGSVALDSAAYIAYGRKP